MEASVIAIVLGALGFLVSWAAKIVLDRFYGPWLRRWLDVIMDRWALRSARRARARADKILDRFVRRTWERDDVRFLVLRLHHDFVIRSMALAFLVGGGWIAMSSSFLASIFSAQPSVLIWYVGIIGVFAGWLTLLMAPTPMRLSEDELAVRFPSSYQTEVFERARKLLARSGLSEQEIEKEIVVHLQLATRREEVRELVAKAAAADQSPLPADVRPDK
jgi:hypothetical protein